MLFIQAASDLNKVFPIHLRMHIRRQLQKINLFSNAAVMGTVVILEERDNLEQLERTCRWPFMSLKYCEWCEYKSGFYEIAFITGDDGAFILIFAPTHAEITQELGVH